MAGIKLPFFIARRRLVLALIGFLALSVAVFVLSHSQILGDQSRPATRSLYREAVVLRGDLREVVSGTGSIAARNSSRLSFLIPGSIQVVSVFEGQSVAKGDVLMALDTSDMEIDISEARLTLQLQELAYNQLAAAPDKYDVIAARASVSRAAFQLSLLSGPPDEVAVRLAQQNYDLQQNNLWRVQAARDEVVNKYLAGVYSQAQVDAAERDVASAELSVKVAEEQLINAQQGVSFQDIAAARASLSQTQATLNGLLHAPNQVDLELARLQIEQAQLVVDSAQRSLSDARLVAPFSGTVVQVNYSIGDHVIPAQTAAVVVDMLAFHVDIPLDELDVPKVKPGQLAFVRVDAWPDVQLSGHIRSVAPDATNMRGVVTYQVRVDLDPTELLVRDGMTATGEIVVSELTNTLLVPNWAIRFDTKTNVAYVNVREPTGAIYEIPVEIGQRGLEMSEVLSGLQEGDIVVVSLEREGFSVFDN